MAVIQAIVNLLGQTVGKILSALLDWAVIALFGRVSGRRKLLLWGLMASAAAWPLLVAGVVAPQAAVFLLAFVPLSGSVAPELVRIIWIVLALLVPIGVSMALHLQAPRRQGERAIRNVLRGFPITVGLAVAFAILLVTVPVLRVVSAVRGRQDTYVPLVTTLASYPTVATLVAATLRRHGMAVVAVPPPWWSALPTRVLQRFGGDAFKGYVAEQTAYFRSPKLEVALYPNALLLRGAHQDTARAHALTIETLTGYPDVFQTLSSDAQEIERQLQNVWTAHRLDPEAHTHAGPLRSRLHEIAAEIARQPLAFEDWQVIYRQLLQLGRALGGDRQILDETLPKESSMTVPTNHSVDDLEARSLSTRHLLGRIVQMGSLLVSKEVQLARAEIKADIRAELDMVKLLIAAAVTAAFGINMLLTAAVFALALWVPSWLAAVGFAGFMLTAAVVVGLIGWSRRVRSPLAVTRKTVKEDVQWAKERLA